MVRQFPWNSVRRVRRKDAGLLRSLRQHLSPNSNEACKRWSSDCLGLSPGDVQVDAPLVLPATSLSSEASRRFASGLVFRLGDGAGREADLVIEANLANRLLHSLLRTPAPCPMDTALAPTQRGLVTFVLAWLLSEVGGAGRWRVRDASATPPPLTADTALIQAEVRLGSTTGLGWLSTEESTLEQLPASASAAPDVKRLLGVEVTLPVVLARAALSMIDLADVAVGDVVVLPTLASRASSAAEHDADLCLADGSFPVRVGPESLRVLHSFRRRDRTMSDDQAVVEHTTTLADQIDIEVVVELGRVHLMASEALKLAAGDVVALQKPVGATVDVRAGGRLLGRGELVDVDGETGVRLLEVFA